MPGGHTTTWLETANRLLHVLIRDDSPDDGNLIQVRMRTDSGFPPNTVNCRYLDAVDLELAWGRLRSGKAPGPDNINAELVIRCGSS